MDKINKKIRALFFVSLGLSIGFPVGILCIVFGATKGWWALLVLGIVLTVAGFYVMPITWIKFGERRRDRAMLYMILNEHIYTVSVLATQTGLSEGSVRTKIKGMIMENVLVGFIFKDDVLELNTFKAQTEKDRRSKKCQTCGAMMYFDGLKFKCDYCGAIEKE